MVEAALEPALHAPARLQIAAFLARVDEAEFATLREVTGVSDSVMSKHLSALAEAGYANVKKRTSGGRQRTWAALTAKGRRAFAAHMAALEELVASARAAAE